MTSLRARWERVAAWWRGVWHRIGIEAREVGKLVRENLLALLVVLVGFFGWGLLTDVLADWLGGVVWQISVGLLCLSLFGWKLLFVIARDGVYLHLRPTKKPGGEA